MRFYSTLGTFHWSAFWHIRYMYDCEVALDALLAMLNLFMSVDALFYVGGRNYIIRRASDPGVSVAFHCPVVSVYVYCPGRADP